MQLLMASELLGRTFEVAEVTYITLRAESNRLQDNRITSLSDPLSSLYASALLRFNFPSTRRCTQKETSSFRSLNPLTETNADMSLFPSP